RLVVALEGGIGGERQSRRRVRCDERPAVFVERDALLVGGDRPLEGRRRSVDIDLDVVNRKLRRLEEIKRGANDELRLARLDLDERIDDSVQLEFVCAYELRARDNAGKHAPRGEAQTGAFHVAASKGGSNHR